MGKCKRCGIRIKKGKYCKQCDKELTEQAARSALRDFNKEYVKCNCEDYPCCKHGDDKERW